MSTTKHTPGPWEKLEQNGVIYIAPKNRVKHLATWTIAQIRYQKEDEANARLIASAPELLEVLKWAQTELAISLGLVPPSKESLEFREKVWRDCLAVIAKAEGRE